VTAYSFRPAPLIPIGTLVRLKVFDGWNSSWLKKVKEDPSESLE